MYKYLAYHERFLLFVNGYWLLVSEKIPLFVNDPMKSLCTGTNN